MKLSICSIVGNEDVHIERFLKSFSKIADEFIIVRAIGDAKPDDTLDKCGGLGVPMRVSHYYNASDERAKWPHVDDFALARQHSFDLATGDWLMWADIDDVWPDTEKNRDFIEALKEGMLEKYSKIHIDYRVPDAGQMVARERFAKRKADPKWHNPVHEFFEVGGQMAYLTGPTIIHSPLNDKRESAERNLRILAFATGRPDLYPDQATLWFYRHRELMFLNKQDEAMEAANKALELLSPYAAESKGLATDCHTVLLYEMLLITAGISLQRDDSSDARARAHGAVNVMPGRREAYALLAQIELSKGNFGKMLAYTSAMRGIDEPVELNRPWTQKDALYSWQGAFLHHQALRLNGQTERAEKAEEEVFQLEGATISIIHPTMADARSAIETYGKWMAAAVNPGAVQWIFAIDAADEYSKHVLRPYKTIICPKGSMAAAEHARKFATGKRVEVIGDNWKPAPGWDIGFSKVNPPRGPYKLAFQMADRKGITEIVNHGTISEDRPRFIICAKEGNSPFPDFQPQHCHYELGWEVNTSHVYAKWLLSQGHLSQDDVIVTLPGREFLYQTCFDTVLTWKEFCEETGLEYGKPYPDASNEATLDLEEYFERNWHRYDDVYFSGPGQTWSGGAWDLIQNFEQANLEKRPIGKFVLLSLRKRPHESRRDTSNVFSEQLLKALPDALGGAVFLVGLNLPPYDLHGVYGVSLQQFATLLHDPDCLGALGPHSGPNGLAGLLAPKGRNIIIFPMEFCPSINSNYPSGMGKCLNLNGNVRHWMPVLSPVADIIAKAKEVFV